MASQSDIDKKLQLIQDLYEDGTGRQLERPGFEEPELREEIEAMNEMKTLLDARPRLKPSAHALQAVLTAAADKSLQEGPRRDRAPMARRSAVYLRVGTVSAVVVVLLSVLSLLQLDLSRTAPEMAASELETKDQASDAAAGNEMDQTQAAVVPPTAELQVAREESVEAGFAPAVPRRTVAEFRERPASQAAHLEMHTANPQLILAETELSENHDDRFAWDQSGEVIEVYQDIEMVGGGVDLGWEPPSVPLELLPQSRPSRRSVQPAGQR